MRQVKIIFNFACRAEELNSVRQKLSAAMADNSGLVRYKGSLKLNWTEILLVPNKFYKHIITLVG